MANSKKGKVPRWMKGRWVARPEDKDNRTEAPVTTVEAQQTDALTPEHRDLLSALAKKIYTPWLVDKADYASGAGAACSQGRGVKEECRYGMEGY